MTRQIHQGHMMYAQYAKSFEVMQYVCVKCRQKCRFLFTKLSWL